MGDARNFIPSFLDVNELKSDINAFEQIRTIYAPLSQVVDSLNDTMLLSGSDAYAVALLFYKTVKSAQKGNVQETKSMYNDLAPRFPGRARTKSKQS